MENGGTLTPAEIVRMKDQLHKIRYARTEEETLFNALDYALNSAAQNADKTHFFNPNNNFLERSINHPVFALYPTAYMYGKVLPEYARALFYSPTKGVSGLVLAPYKRIIRTAARIFGQEIPDEAWGKFAPLVGYQAASKIRNAMADGTNENGKEGIDPITYLLLYTLIPGLPTDIGVTAPKWLTRATDKFSQQMESGTLNPFDVAGAAAVGMGEQVTNSMGFGRGLVSVGRVATELGNQAEENNGSIIDAAGNFIGDMAESLQDILTNDGKLGK
jgi:hypothetical protein